MTNKKKDQVKPAPEAKPAPKAKQIDTLFIQSKADRFRRCGCEFNKNGEAFPLDRFTEEQLAILEAEPALICQRKTDVDAK